MSSMEAMIVRVAEERRSVPPRRWGQSGPQVEILHPLGGRLRLPGKALTLGILLVFFISAIAFNLRPALVPKGLWIAYVTVLLSAIGLPCYRVLAVERRLESLRQSIRLMEESRKELLESLPLIVLEIRRDGAISTVNGRFKSLFNVDEESCFGKPLSALVPGSDLDLADTLASIAAHKPGNPALRTQFSAGSGQRLHVLWFAAEPSRDGTMLRYGVDITDEVASASERSQLVNELESLRKEIESSNKYLEIAGADIDFQGMVGRSDAFRYVLYKIGQVASTDATVLIEGETGVGKELVAKTIHNNSPRRNSPLVCVNCAALPASLIESELFGHDKGAYTGADRSRAGRFELAQGGTIFLDEIGEMPLDLQSKLLRVLQDGEITRLGGTRAIRTDVRVIVATNVNLEGAVEQGRFRKDLYYRLEVFPITVPPLRDRRDDIPLLTQHLVNKLALKLQRPVPEIPLSIVDKLTAYDWPGNIRELANVLENAIITSAGAPLTLPKDFGTMRVTWQSQPVQSFMTMNEMERQYIETVLKSVGGKIAGPGGAAAILGLHPNTLRGRMARLRVSRSASISEAAIV